MSCCGNSGKSNPPQEVAPGPSKSTILNRRTRKWMHLHQSMVDSIPDGGWVFLTSLNGVPLEVKGTSPQDVMSKTRAYFFSNNAPFDELKFWIEANIQWVNKTNVKHHLVSAADLLAVASESGGAAPEQGAPLHPPSEWGSIAWKFLGLVLARDRYDVMEFIAVMRLVTDMLNPSINPRLGCAECHIKASGMLNDLIHRPPVDIAAARIWLVKKHNVVNARLGKPELGMSEAAEANLWN